MDLVVFYERIPHEFLEIAVEGDFLLLHVLRKGQKSRFHCFVHGFRPLAVRGQEIPKRVGDAVVHLLDDLTQNREPPAMVLEAVGAVDGLLVEVVDRDAERTSIQIGLVHQLVDFVAVRLGVDFSLSVNCGGGERDVGPGDRLGRDSFFDGHRFSLAGLRTKEKQVHVTLRNLVDSET